MARVRSLLTLVVIFVLSNSCWGQGRPAQNPISQAGTAASQPPSVLPVKRVVLYKNGVGYFEHLGTVQGRQNVDLSFTSGQLDDVLKSLTVLDLNGGRIAGVAYGVSAPFERELQDVRLPLGEKPSLAEFLGALRGARLEIKNGPSTITGRLMSVDRKTRISGGTTLEIDYLSLLADNGEIRTTELSPAFSVKVLDQKLAGRLDRYLDITASARDEDVRRVTISADGAGQRSIFASYISEVPVWKSTYRIVLSSKAGQSPLLQGWAIVDNTVGQDWDNVELSLVAGAPQSFIQTLSQPYYSRRPVVPLVTSLNSAPQTYQATLSTGTSGIVGRILDASGASVPGAIVRAFGSDGALVGETRSDNSGIYRLQRLPAGLVRIEVNSDRFKKYALDGLSVTPGASLSRDVRLEVGSVSESIEVRAETPALQTSTSSVSVRSAAGSGRGLGSGAGLGRGVSRLSAPPPPPRPSAAPPARQIAMLDEMLRSQTETARAQELGDLFEYKLKEPITIRKNRSALVPIAQASIGAEKVSVWNEQSGLSRPRRALWLSNTTGLTLDGGSFSVAEDDAFAGEGIFDPIHPGEKRLISYATDLALNASSRNTSEQQRISRVRVSRGVLTQYTEVVEKKTYTFRNEDASPRSVLVEHPVRAGFALRGDAKPIETTADWNRFRLRIDPKQTASLVVEEVRPVEYTYMLSNLDADQVQLFVRQGTMDKALEEGLRKILAQKAAAADLEIRKSARESEKEEIYDDQQRLRENMKALKGSAEEKALLQRYTQQLNQQETRLEAVGKEITELDTQIERAGDDLQKLIEQLVFDVKI